MKRFLVILLFVFVTLLAGCGMAEEEEKVDIIPVHGGEEQCRFEETANQNAKDQKSQNLLLQIGIPVPQQDQCGTDSLPGEDEAEYKTGKSHSQESFQPGIVGMGDNGTVMVYFCNGSSP